MRNRFPLLALIIILSLALVLPVMAQDPYPGRELMQANISSHKGQIKIINVMTPRDGEDHAFIEITNVYTGTVNLDGWFFASRTKGKFTTLSDFTLAKGATCRLSTRDYSPECPKISAGWSEQGDTIYLQDKNGDVVDSYDYIPPPPTPTLPPTPTPDKRLDSYEPNDQPEPDPGKENGATVLPKNATLEDLTLHPGDKDWFKSPLSQGRFELAITPSKPAIEFHVSVYQDPDAEAVWSDVSNQETRYTFTVADNAEIYILVEGAHGQVDYSSMGTYEISLTDNPAPTPTPDRKLDRYEPNDNKNSATVLPKNASLGDLTLNMGDRDWFYSPLTPGRYELTVEPSNPAVEFRISAFENPDGDAVWSKVSDSKISYKFELQSDATMYFLVEGAQQIEYSLLGSYEISLTVAEMPTPTPRPDNGLEPNDSFETASELVRNGSHKELKITSNDVDFFMTPGLSAGRYTLTVQPSDRTVDLLVDVYDQNRVAIFKGVRTNGNTVRLQFEVPAGTNNAAFYFKVYGVGSVDYSKYGTYSISVSAILNPGGEEDAHEPNNDQAHASLIAYSDTIQDLSLFSHSIDENLKPDVDYFQVYIPKAMDWYCMAESEDTVLDLGIHMNVPGKPDMEGYRAVYYPNFKGVNPYFGVHGLKGGETVYVKVFLENRAAKDAVAGIKYQLTCTGGNLEPPKPTKPAKTAPTATPAPTKSSGSSGSGGSGTTPPTPTPQPDQLTFTARLIGSAPSQATPAPAIEFVTATFRVYSDTNGNKSPDPNEWISGLRILIIDSTTGQVVQTLVTNSSGQVTLTLTKQQMDVYRYAVPLLNTNRPLEKENTIEPPLPIYPSIIP